MIHKHRGNRRKQNYIKSIRKEKIARQIYDSKPLNEDGWHYFNSLHEYSKGKIHCSCPMCSAKTNTKINKSAGPMSGRFFGNRLSTTNGRYGKKNYKISELKKVDSMNYQFSEYCVEGT